MSVFSLKAGFEENHTEKAKTIQLLLRDLNDTISKKEYYRVGSTALELIQFCESITDLEYNIRSINILLSEEELK